MVVKEKPIVAREENPLLLGKPLVTKENPLLLGKPIVRETLCCQGKRIDVMVTMENGRIHRYHHNGLNYPSEHTSHSVLQ